MRCSSDAHCATAESPKHIPFMADLADLDTDR